MDGTRTFGTDLFQGAAEVLLALGITPLGAGDPFLVQNLSTLGLEPPPGQTPHAAFAALGGIDLGPLTLGGPYPYVVFTAPEVSLSDVSLPGGRDILVQWAPPLPIRAIGVLDSPRSLAAAPTLGPLELECAGLPCGHLVFNRGGLDAFPGTTHAIGSSLQLAPIEVLEPIDVGSQNVVFVAPEVVGLGNVQTTGVVGVLEPVLAPLVVEALRRLAEEERVFIVPTIDDDIGVELGDLGEALLTEIEDALGEGEEEEEGEQVAIEGGGGGGGGGLTTTESSSGLMCGGG